MDDHDGWWFLMDEYMQWLGMTWNVWDGYIWMVWDLSMGWKGLGWYSIYECIWAWRLLWTCLMNVRGRMGQPCLLLKIHSELGRCACWLCLTCYVVFMIYVCLRACMDESCSELTLVVTFALERIFVAFCWESGFISLCICMSCVMIPLIDLGQSLLMIGMKCNES